MALYQGLFAIKILVKNLGLLRERMYYVKSDKNKRRYTNTLPMCLKCIRPPIGQVEDFHKSRQAENSGVAATNKRHSSEGHETECLCETQNSRTSVEEGTVLRFLSCRSFFNRYHRVHVNRYANTHRYGVVIQTSDYFTAGIKTFTETHELQTSV
jgi:hypothetical protein